MKELKIYGFTHIYDFPCVCWGTRGYFFKMRYIKGVGFKVYKGWVYTNEIQRQQKWKVFGFVLILPLVDLNMDEESANL